MSPPIAVVVGALGAQGSGVVSALLASSKPYKIRALTSNIASPDATRLANNSPEVEVVKADLASIDSLVSAFKGATFIFANTVFRAEIFMTQGAEAAQELEATQGLNLVRAASEVAKEGALKHLIWSTLSNAEKTSGGKYKIPHFQSKVPADEYILDESNWLKDKTTFLRVGMYGSNLKRIPYVPVYVKGAHKYIISFPCSSSALIPMVGDETTNVGLIAHAIFQQPEKTMGKYVLGVGDYLTPAGWADALAKVLNADVTFLETSMESYESLWGPIGTEIGLMMKYIDEFGKGSYTMGLTEDQVVTPSDLGVQDQLHSTEDSLKKLNWKEVLA